MGAPLNPVPQVLRMFWEGFVDNDKVYKWGNVLHFGYTGGAPTNTDCIALAHAVNDGWSINLASLCPAPTSLQSVTITDLTSDSSGEGTFLTNLPGTRGDDSIPANACVLVSYPASTRYKGGHPRTYLYCLGNADLEGAAHWSAAAVSEVQTKWGTFLNSLIGHTQGSTTIASVGFVRYRGKFLPNSGPPHYYLNFPIYTTVPPLGGVVRPEMASQRRRIGRSRK